MNMLFSPTWEIRFEKEWQHVIRCDKNSGAWELILKFPNENVFLSNLGDKVIRCGK